MPRIVLASTSPYRRELLSRLRVAFDVMRPEVEETSLADETPRATALRLARAKASAVGGRITDALVIGSDQVADLDGQALGKPGAHEPALAQLELMQGKTVIFHTAVALLDTRSGSIEADCVPTRVRFRSLPRAALDAYLRLDQPYDCAGAAKIEALGITLVESVHADDPTALIGLPLVRLTSMLLGAGVVIPPR